MPGSGEFALLRLNPQRVTCQPEPPWIKRGSYGVKFTDEGLFADDVDFCNTSERRKNDELSEDEDKPNKKEELEMAGPVRPRASSEKNTSAICTNHL